jgi:RNA polymerase sigma factor (sigma-70 family)
MKMTHNSRQEEMYVLYADLQPKLWRILVSNLRMTDDVLEDACQSAWIWLMQGRDSVAPGNELGWLSTTATREALNVQRRRSAIVPLDQGDEPVQLADFRTTAPEPDQALEIREKLAEVRSLPVRQQRIVWLQGLGYEYSEIAAVTGESRRTVERQLSRARQRLMHLVAID